MSYSNLRSLTRPFLFILFFMAFLISSCDQITDTTDDQQNGDGNTIEHSSSITSDETWGKDKTHVISGFVEITNATVIIEPGATIIFKSGANLNIGSGGGLIADGTTATITFTGETKQAGFWDYIEFDNDAVNANSIMKNCIIEYGGGYSSSGAMLYINNKATITGCTIRNSDSYGVEIDDDAQPVFTGNTITGNKLSPIKGDFKSIAYIGQGTYSGNGQDFIELSSGTISETVTILSQDIPYRLNGYNAITNATVTIQPGTQFEMNSGADLTIDTGGGLIADGSSSAIIFTGSTKQAGFWDYIEFQSDAVNANCVLKNVTVEYGGGYSSTGAMVYIDNSPTITECTFRYSDSHGLKIDDDARPVLTDNTITGNKLSPVYGYFKSIASIGAGDYSGNAQDYIDIQGGTLSESITLLKLTVPYRLNGYNVVKNAVLTIQPGTVIEFNSGADLDINTNGGIIAQGTDTDSIKFTGAAKQKGYWDYIEIQDDAATVNCIFNKCVIEYGGGYSSSGAMIYLNSSNATLTNSRIQHSDSWGIIYRSGSTPDLSGNIYYDNTLGDVKEN